MRNERGRRGRIYHGVQEEDTEDTEEERRENGLLFDRFSLFLMYYDNLTYKNPFPLPPPCNSVYLLFTSVVNILLPLLLR